MKVKKIKAFSLVELIIVSSILIIVSSSGVLYFSDFIDDLTFKKTINSINDNFETLDNKINKKEIFDYEIYLSWWTDYYSSSENIFDLNTFIEFNELNNWIWKFSFNWATSWTGNIKLYKDYKFIKNDIINYDWSFTWNLDNINKYKITWSFSWNTLNTINFNYFDNKKFIKLIKIMSGSVNLDSIIIKNILWKKKFWDNDLNEKIILVFENEVWRIENLEIKK